MNVPFLDLAAHHSGLQAEILERLQKVATTCDFILGGETATFEEDFAKYIGVHWAIGVGNCLDALRLSLAALDIGPGDEALLPANSFIATALAVTAVGARPVLVDCDPHTYTICPAECESRVTPRTRAIIPVHLTGQPAEMEPLLDLARRKELLVVEDVAQAPGATYQDRRCGALGIAGCFSFYPGKNLGAFGDAGAVTTNDERMARRLRHLRNYGQEAKYVHLEKGLNSRLDTIQAAVLNVKFRHLDHGNGLRKQHADRYRQLLAGVGDLAFQHEQRSGTHVYHLFVIETEHRDELQKHLQAHGVQTLIHYPIPIHLQAAYRDLGYRPGDFPVAERLARHSLSLPIYPELSDQQVEYVAGCIRNCFAGRQRSR